MTGNGRFGREDADAPRRQDGDLDSLLQPSLKGQLSPSARSGEPPWRLESQFWVAFFGGVLPATVIAYLNSRRLGISAKRQTWILVAGAAGFVAVLTAVVAIHRLELASEMMRSQRGVRLADRVVSVLLYLLFHRLQKPAERLYHWSSRDVEYSSLWKAGLLAVLGLGLVQGFVMSGLLDALGIELLRVRRP